MFNALSEYPRDVSLYTFSTRFDARFGHPTGRTKAFTEPTPAISDETLQVDIRHFKAATADIQTDTQWMQAMPVPMPLIAAFTEARLVIKVANEKPVSLNLIGIPSQRGYRMNSRSSSLKSPIGLSTQMTGSPTCRGWVTQPLQKKKETGVGDRARNIMRIRNLTSTGIILALGTERLYLEPTQKSAIVRWTQKTIGSRHIEFGMPYQCLQVPILANIAHVEGIPDPEPDIIFDGSATFRDAFFAYCLFYALTNTQKLLKRSDFSLQNLNSQLNASSDKS